MKKTTKCALILALTIISISFLSSCKDDEINYNLTSGRANMSMDENTACFLNIGIRPILVSENNLVYHNTIDAYCTDGDANPRFVNRQYIRCNGKDMQHMYNDPALIGRYEWGTTTKEPISSMRIEMDYFDEDYVFEFERFNPIQLIDELPIVIERDKGLQLRYAGGGSGQEMYVSIGNNGNGMGKKFIDNGGILEFTPEEVRELTLMFLDDDDWEKYLQAFEEKYGFRPTAMGYTVYIKRVKKVKDEFKNGKNIFANISQTELTGVLFQLKGR